MPGTGHFPSATNALDIVARKVQPNPKCGGCLHYNPQTVTCQVGMMPQNCGDGLEPTYGYAPLSEMKPGADDQPPTVGAAQAVAPHDPVANNDTMADWPMQILGDEAPQVVAVMQSVVQAAVQKSQNDCRACSYGPMTGQVPTALAGMLLEHSCSYSVTEMMVKSAIGKLSPHQRAKVDYDVVEAMLEECLEPLSKGFFRKSHVGFKKLTAKLAHKPGIKNPKAAAAAIGKKKYGEKKMGSAAKHGKPLKDSQAKKSLGGFAQFFGKSSQTFTQAPANPKQAAGRVNRQPSAPKPGSVYDKNKPPVTKIPSRKEMAATLKNPSPAMRAVMDKMHGKSKVKKTLPGELDHTSVAEGKPTAAPTQPAPAAQAGPSGGARSTLGPRGRT